MNSFYNNFKDRQEASKKDDVKRERSFGEQMFIPTWHAVKKGGVLDSTTLFFDIFTTRVLVLFV